MISIIEGVVFFSMMFWWFCIIPFVPLFGNSKRARKIGFVITIIAVELFVIQFVLVVHAAVRHYWRLQ